MRLIVLFGLFCFLFFVPICYGQKTETLCEVTIKGIKPERFMVGQKVLSIDSTVLSQNRFYNLSDFLQFVSPLVFKSYGVGQTATISMRGTSANHTALLWNGININFPSLGLTDFSTIPVSGFDQMSIQYGSSASCVGTDAVGGSILLSSSPRFNQKGVTGSLAWQSETQNNHIGQAGMRWNTVLKNNWKLAIKSQFHFSEFKNDFGLTDIQDKKGYRLPVEPSNTSQNSIINDIYLQDKKGNLFTVNSWISNNSLVIQPNKAEIAEFTDTKAYRFQSSAQLQKLLLRAVFIRDVTDFGKLAVNDSRLTIIDRYIARGEYDFSWVKSCNKGTFLKTGIEFTHFVADVDDYVSEGKTENRSDFYALFRHQFNSQFLVSLNLRQALVERYNPPFTPSLGLDYRLLKNSFLVLNVLGNISRNYRVPTLNERYWYRLGNPDILPENSFNKEVSLRAQFKPSGMVQSTVLLTGFHNLIDNWTYWNPQKEYKVDNLQQVLSKGFEVSWNLALQSSGFSANSQLEYAYTHSTQQKEFGAYTRDFIDKQLIYIPKHSVSHTISSKIKSFTITALQLVNSERYTTFDHSTSPYAPYYLLHLIGSYHLNVGKQSIDFMARGNNITNTLYPNLKNFAMPMRSGSLSIIVNLS
ncbi:MAG: TonB-dependent receptor plug domain-containing protein [Leadbetterella sp.]